MLTRLASPCPASFRNVLHEAIQSALRDGADEIQKNGAIQIQAGWMHIHGACLDNAGCLSN